MFISATSGSRTWSADRDLIEEATTEYDYTHTNSDFQEQLDDEADLEAEPLSQQQTCEDVNRQSATSEEETGDNGDREEEETDVADDWQLDALEMERLGLPTAFGSTSSTKRKKKSRKRIHQEQENDMISDSTVTDMAATAASEDDGPDVLPISHRVSAFVLRALWRDLVLPERGTIGFFCFKDESNILDQTTMNSDRVPDRRAAWKRAKRRLKDCGYVLCTSDEASS